MRDMDDPGALAGATGAGDEPSRAAWLVRTVAPSCACVSFEGDSTRTILRIIIRPLGKGEWAAEAETGDLLVARSRSPFFDAAQALLALGADPAQLVTMAHAKRPDFDCFLPIPLVRAALLVVEEGNRSARFRKWSDPAGRLRSVGAKGDSLALSPSAALQAASEKDGRR